MWSPGNFEEAVFILCCIRKELCSPTARSVLTYAVHVVTKGHKDDNDQVATCGQVGAPETCHHRRYATTQCHGNAWDKTVAEAHVWVHSPTAAKTLS